MTQRDEVTRNRLTDDKSNDLAIRKITLATDQLTLIADRMGLDFGDEDDECAD